MRFDVVVIGGGPAGLSCAIAVAEQGKRCAVVSSGQSALYFSSGSLDLLARLPDGTPVEMPLAALPQLAQQAPQHPYALIGPGRVAALSAAAQRLLARCGLQLQGEGANNHLRITPLGTRRATAQPAGDPDAAADRPTAVAAHRGDRHRGVPRLPASDGRRLPEPRARRRDGGSLSAHAGAGQIAQ